MSGIGAMAGRPVHQTTSSDRRGGGKADPARTQITPDGRGDGCGLACRLDRGHERSSLPLHLVSQVEDYIAQLGPFDLVFINGDLVANHAYVENGRLVGIIDWGDATRQIDTASSSRFIATCSHAIKRVSGVFGSQRLARRRRFSAQGFGACLAPPGHRSRSTPHNRCLRAHCREVPPPGHRHARRACQATLPGLSGRRLGSHTLGNCDILGSMCLCRLWRAICALCGTR